jgi:dUTP pyrophosphatase
VDVPHDLGIPISYVQQPDYEIVDLSRRAPASSNQIEPDDEAMPGPSQQPDQGQGTKRPNMGTDSEKEPAREPKRRQRRTRAQLREDNEKKRKRETPHQSTEESENQPTRPEQPFPFLPSGMSQYLPDTSDSDLLDSIRTLEVDVTAGSNVPEWATDGSAAYDVKAHQTIVIPPNSTGLVPLNLRLATPKNHFMYLLFRSSLALKGITIEGGVIDPDYNQEVKAILRNSTSTPFKVQKGQRIAQAVFLPIIQADFKLVENLSNSDEDLHNGFGSTGDQ